MKTIKLTEEVSRRRIELIVYAAYISGFMSCSEGKLITHKDNWEEIHRLIAQISKDNLPAKYNCGKLIDTNVYQKVQ